MFTNESDLRCGRSVVGIARLDRVVRIEAELHLVSNRAVGIGGLWLGATHHSRGNVSSEQLWQIASRLDAKGYLPPAEYLEGNYAKELRAFNSRHSNSKWGANKTWSQLVSRDEVGIEMTQNLSASSIRGMHGAEGHGIVLPEANTCNPLRRFRADGKETIPKRTVISERKEAKGTDALDAALCSLGGFSRTPKRASARHGRRQRMTASDLAENAGVPDRFQQVVILYPETYEARVSDVYRTLRHKVIVLAHFWRFIRDKHPSVKRCSEILPRHIRDYIPHAIAHARAVQRGPGAGEEVRPTAHSWLVDLRVFFSDLCAWAIEPDSPFKRFAPRTIPMTRHTRRLASSSAMPPLVMLSGTGQF